MARDDDFAAERLMELEVGTGAGYRREEFKRQVQRNGCRDGDCHTRAGNLEPWTPKLRKGSYFPSFL